MDTIFYLSIFSGIFGTIAFLIMSLGLWMVHYLNKPGNEDKYYSFIVEKNQIPRYKNFNWVWYLLWFFMAVASWITVFTV